MSYAGYHFEVFGKVQGVFFRKYTVKEAQSLDLVGWVRNTDAGTVEGDAQGRPEKLAEFKEFLTKRGSPQSHIERCKFNNEFSGHKHLDYDTFEQRS
ncbi:hypothetical protein WJX81_003015 [Elliptochloris bilobata]|uniref:Acylphosphatase n=1 Tax=Elliptochloris bilobata TaxID=381761 RepID=A0AAW1SCK2_9CHLO